MPNINFDPFDRGGFPRGEQLRTMCANAAVYMKRQAEKDPDADGTEWFLYHLLRKIAAGEIKEI